MYFSWVGDLTLISLLSKRLKEILSVFLLLNLEVFPSIVSSLSSHQALRPALWHHELQGVQELRQQWHRCRPGEGWRRLHGLRLRAGGQHHRVRGGVRGDRRWRVAGCRTVCLLRRLVSEYICPLLSTFNSKCWCWQTWSVISVWQRHRNHPHRERRVSRLVLKGEMLHEGKSVSLQKRLCYPKVKLVYHIKSWLVVLYMDENSTPCKHGAL